MKSNLTDPPVGIEQYYEKSHAIIIGISSYKEETSLPNAFNDAVAIKNVLAEKYGFDNVIGLFNEKATGDKIRELLQDTLRDESKIGRKDRVLIYYSGHGRLRTDIKPNGEEVQTGYIIPYDSRLGRYWSSIEMDDLIRSCQGSKAKHILLILDCCYSGFATTRSAESMVPPKNVDRNYLNDITRKRAIQVLAATQKDEPANDSGILYGFSAFTGALLGILKNEKDPIENGVITASEIGTVLQQEVVNQKGVFQRPSYNVLAGSEGGDFIFKIIDIKKFKPLSETISAASLSPIFTSEIYSKIEQKMKSFIVDAVNTSKFIKLPEIKLIGKSLDDKWEVQGYSGIIPIIVNFLSGIIIPYYRDSINDLIADGIKSKGLPEGGVMENWDTGSIYMDPSLEPGHSVNVVLVSQYRLTFHFEAHTYIKKMKAHIYNEKLFIDIENAIIELTLSLTQITHQGMMFSSSSDILGEPLMLSTKRVEINSNPNTV